MSTHRLLTDQLMYTAPIDWLYVMSVSQSTQALNSVWKQFYLQAQADFEKEQLLVAAQFARLTAPNILKTFKSFV